MKLTNEYVAGFTDGEGYIGIIGRATVITWGQKPREVLDLMQTWCTDLGVKSYIYWRKPDKARNRPNGIYTLTVSRRYDVRKVCEILLPHLVVKREAALHVLEWIEKHPISMFMGKLPREALATLAAEGYTQQQAAELLHCSRHKVYRDAKEYGIQFAVGWTTKNGQRVRTMTEQERRIRRQSKERTAQCHDCGIPIYAHATRCRACHERTIRGTPRPENRTRQSLICSECGATYDRVLSQLALYQTSYCSLACKGKARTLTKQGKWSQHSTECKQCGTTLIPHVAQGLCKHCYESKTRKARRCAKALAAQKDA